MNVFRKWGLAYRAFRQLGPAPLTQYLIYQLGLRSGYLRGRTPAAGDPWLQEIELRPEQRKQFRLKNILPLPDPAKLRQTVGTGDAGLTEADEIVAGQTRLFGHAVQPLDLAPAAGLYHWTEFERGLRVWGAEDVKWVWEPARCGWAFRLGRAYHLSGQPRYAQAFWQHTERFLDSNPPELGPHWASAQEVALRLIALTFASHTMAGASESTAERNLRLGWAIATHAGRIPATLAYARAQNNNHLLTEALGLYTAGLVLPDHPQAPVWRAQGWRWFHEGLRSQIAEDGTYVQHSMNYHRLMLQASLWMVALARSAGDSIPTDSAQRLAAATRWALALTDPESGRAPNLGPNDGALILPLTGLPQDDYRPTLQAASQVFAGAPAFPPGPWDELAHWLGVSAGSEQAGLARRQSAGPCCILRNEPSQSWGYLRVPEFAGRPGHADVLHFDLWWRGLNVALDPGTYAYNASPPWQHALAHTGAYNTVTVAGRDQMTRAGKFLWLDWAESRVLARDKDAGGGLIRLAAAHDGYRSLGVTHCRTVTACPDGRWEIQDLLERTSGAGRLRDRTSAILLRLHWLMPAWPYEIRADRRSAAIRLETPLGHAALKVEVAEHVEASAALFQAGQRVWGAEHPPEPTRGWAAPSYGQKMPALSLSLQVMAELPVLFKSEWVLG